MLGGNNVNSMLPVFVDENRFAYPPNAANQLQFFGNVSGGCNVDAVNYFGTECIAPMVWPNKRTREIDEVSRRQQKVPFSLNYNVCRDEGDRSVRITDPNHVSTGLRLSYDDDERNSSVTSASGSMTGAPSRVLSLGDNIRTELDWQKEEFDQYIKVQEEQLAKGVRDMNQRHMASFLTAIERCRQKATGERLGNRDHEP